MQTFNTVYLLCYPLLPLLIWIFFFKLIKWLNCVAYKSRPVRNYKRLIELFPSTEIFSKRRKIYAFWRETRVINFSEPEKQRVNNWTPGGGMPCGYFKCVYMYICVFVLCMCMYVYVCVCTCNKHKLYI